jgi:hypothetical protein
MSLKHIMIQRELVGHHDTQSQNTLLRADGTKKAMRASKPISILRNTPLLLGLIGRSDTRGNRELNMSEPNEIIVDVVHGEQHGSNWVTVSIKCAARDKITLGELLKAVSQCPNSDWLFNGCGKDFIDAAMNPPDCELKSCWHTSL